MQTKLLLVDDDTAFASTLMGFLKRNGFEVMVARNGNEALQRIRTSQPDLILLDINMPVLDGREMLRRLRAGNDHTPVIMLTEIRGSGEHTMALTDGADDYIDKPFDGLELIARINAVLRRARPLGSAEYLVSGPLELNRTAHRASLGGKAVNLTPRALAVLEYLMLHPNEILSHDRLLDAVWDTLDVGPAALTQRINELRVALKDDHGDPRYIRTAYNEGYSFIAEVRVKAAT